MLQLMLNIRFVMWGCRFSMVPKPDTVGSTRAYPVIHICINICTNTNYSTPPN